MQFDKRVEKGNILSESKISDSQDEVDKLLFWIDDRLELIVHDDLFLDNVSISYLQDSSTIEEGKTPIEVRVGLAQKCAKDERWGVSEWQRILSSL